MRQSYVCMLAVALLSFAAPAVQAQDAAYVVSYFETMPAAQNEAAALVRGLGEASRKDAGNLRFDVLQRISQPNHFAIIEAWKDAAAQSLHMAGAHVKQFREKLQPLLRSPYDERPHAPMNVGSAQLANATRDAVYVVTHVDFIPPEKENGIAMVKSLAESSRKDDGNLRFEGLQQISRPNHLTLVEVWKDSKALDNHGVTPHMKSFREKLSPVSGSLFDERLYKSIN